MAGTPQRREMIVAVNDAGGEDALIARIESGETIADLARGFGVSRSALSNWLNRTPEGKQRIARARETASHALAEETLRIADGATNSDDRAKRLAISARQWLASKWNRPEYGESPTVALQLNVGELFLEALKQPPPPVPAHLVVGNDEDT